MNLKHDWLPDDGFFFGEGFTLAHGAEGRCLPSEHVHENPLNKFLSLHPLRRRPNAGKSKRRRGKISCHARTHRCVLRDNEVHSAVTLIA